MKKYLGNLLFFITSLLCVIVLFGCFSIHSKAATKMKPATQLRFDGTAVKYTTGSAGYYTVAVTYKTASGKEILHDVSNMSGKRGANEPDWIISLRVVCTHEEVGEYVIYVFNSKNKIPNYDTIEQYKKDSHLTMASKSVNVKNKLKVPSFTSIKPVTVKKKKYYRLKWKKRACYFDIDDDVSDIESFFLADGKDHYDIPVEDYTKEVSIRAYSSHLEKDVASDTIYLTIPGSKDDGVLRYSVSFSSNGGSYVPAQKVAKGANAVKPANPTKDGYVFAGWYADTTLTKAFNFNTPITSNTCLYAKWKKVETPAPGNDEPVETDPEKETPGDDSASGRNVTVESGKAALPMTITQNGITYYIGADGIATVTKIGAVKKASISNVTADGVTYPVKSIADNACKGNKKIKKLKIADSVESIGKKAFYNCKKLKTVTIKANKSLKIKKNAFNKLAKESTITIKGAKKAKLGQKLRKQTNATVNKK
ncbi:InlB B-repeat-containing protein [Butyrivibrio sp. FC2001]|uniref:InlB B-repeat-containing protein n=1 Tax=Butyrivibrio sp. FC2001 TaxID=1280671 RepID=UPI0003F69896|nr:InlB B-repeat-containing protein [Butyrivibrio sp. FC2001]